MIFFFQEYIAKLVKVKNKIDLTKRNSIYMGKE